MFKVLLKISPFLIATFCLMAVIPKALAAGTANNAWNLVEEFSSEQYLPSLPSSTIMSNGKVLIMGSDNDATEIYNPQNNSWEFTDPLASLPNTSTNIGINLTNKKILIVGHGSNSSGQVSAQLYDPANGNWSIAGNPIIPVRIADSATLLPNGRVLVVGGYGGDRDYDTDMVASAEIYTPNSNSWSQTSSMENKRAYHTATLLKNGKVLVIGGGNNYFTGVGAQFQGVNTLSSSELYDYPSSTWTPTSSLSVPRAGHTATMLLNGKVLVTGGGKDGYENFQILSSAELYDPNTGQWTQTGSMPTGRIWHAATLLPSGKVLVTGGLNGIKGYTSNLSAYNTAEMYDPSTGLWTSVDINMNEARSFHAATLLNDGRVFVAGGINWIDDSDNMVNSAEIFTPKGYVPPSPSISLKDYKQNRNADGSFVPWANQKLFEVSSCPTMGNEGCAITSFVDVIASYGLQNLPNGNVTDPGNLNKYFAQKNGTHSGCGIYFNTAGRAVNYNVLHNEFPWVPLATRVRHIDEALNAGNLVIAGTGGHFVVLYKKAPNPAADGSPDYYIADPFRYAPYATGDRTGKLLSETYQSINQLKDKLQVVVVENKAPKPGKTWVIAAHSPVQFMVTDPEGNQTGFDTATNSYVQDIPDSTYGLQQGLIDDTGIEPPQPDILYYGQDVPAEGTYKIEVTGTGSGPYTLDLAVANGSDDTFMQTLSGTAVAGKTDTYLITNSSDETQEPSIKKQVTFAVLKADIESLYSQKQIKNKLVYATLKLQVEIAEKASLVNRQPLGNKLAILALKTFQYELNKAKGKSITEDAYQILYKDADVLIKNLQNDSTTPIPIPGS